MIAMEPKHNREGRWEFEEVVSEKKKK